MTASASQDPALARYRSAVGQGWAVMYNDGNIWGTHCSPRVAGISAPGQCRTDSLRLKTDAQTLLSLMAGVTPSADLVDADRLLRQALTEIQPDVDQLVASIDAGSDQTQDVKLRILSHFTDSWYETKAIDCWPKSVQRNGAEAVSAFSCVGG